MATLNLRRIPDRSNGLPPLQRRAFKRRLRVAEPIRCPQLYRAIDAEYSAIPLPGTRRTGAGLTRQPSRTACSLWGTTSYRPTLATRARHR